jgi:hypothetical protein
LPRLSAGLEQLLPDQTGWITEFYVEGDVDEYIGQEPEYGND